MLMPVSETVVPGRGDAVRPLIVFLHRRDRPKLAATVASLKTGNTLIITKPDRSPAA
ncbi:MULTISPECIES: hypothetical protein [unclassified Nonomuraea]|uniref:hypothetical protein n=1 Tax=unclassified Nonomuraea TaxID=2593643 RepID=UPI0033E2C23F